MRQRAYVEILSTRECSPNFPPAQYLDIRTAEAWTTRQWLNFNSSFSGENVAYGLIRIYSPSLVIYCDYSNSLTLYKCWRTLLRLKLCSDPPRQGNVKKAFIKYGRYMGKFRACLCSISLIHTTWCRLGTSRPLGERSQPVAWPRSGPPRATKSREVFVPRHMKSDEGLFWKSTLGDMISLNRRPVSSVG